MGTTVLLLFACLALVVVLIARKVHLALHSPLAKIPSAHPLAPWTGAWMLWLRYKEDVNKTVNEAHTRLGPLVRLGPSEVSVNCVEGGVKMVYGNKQFLKHEFYLCFRNFGASPMFATIDPAHHSVKRKRVTNVFSKTYIQSSQDLQAVIQEVLFQRLLPRFARAAKSGKKFDVMKDMRGVTMDLATSYSWGLGNGTRFLVDEASFDKFQEMYMTSRPACMFFAPVELPTLTNLIAKVGWSPLPRDSFYSNDTTDAWCLELCDGAEATITSGGSTKPGYNPVVYRQLKEATAKENLSATPSLTKYRTSPLIFQRHRKLSSDTEKVITKPRSPQQVEIAAELLDEMVATNDVLGNTLTYICWELSRHPSIQQRLRDEMLVLSPNMKQGGDGSGSLPNAKGLDQQPLLHAIIMETMRLWPTNPGLEPRITPPNTSLAGYDGIPAGVRVSASPFCLHRDPAVYPEPEAWRPERWMPKMEDRGKWAGNGQADKSFFGFSSGLRMCIGSHLSMHLMKYVIGSLYTNFKTSIVDDVGMDEQCDGFIAAMVADKLILKAERWE